MDPIKHEAITSAVWTLILFQFHGIHCRCYCQIMSHVQYVWQVQLTGKPQISLV